MTFVSTRGATPPTTVVEALFRSLAPDGGLYVPRQLRAFSASEVDALLHAPLAEGAARILGRLGVDVLERPALEALVAETLTFPLPLRELEEVGNDEPGQLGDELAVLELFWGPTLAFKDVGARFMARLMARMRPAAAAAGLVPEDSTLTILAATSGDTGSAVAHAFHRLPGFRVAVLFPRGQVSPAQQRLFTTLGDNVLSLEVDGSFDDCQRLVKTAFADDDLRRYAPLASANSISVGRLLPQTLYYYELCRILRAQEDQRPLWVSVPSGNFGNLTAGLYARRLGLPIAQFVAATNRNDVVPRYLGGGDYAPRPSVQTPSNAMDVGDPSNFRRIEALYANEAALRRDLLGAYFDDEETLAAMRDVHQRTGVLLDPHAAVAYLGLRHALRQHERPFGRRGVLLATAHPAKFREVVERALGEPPEVPEAIARCLDLPEHKVRLENSYDALRQLLVRRD